MIDYGVVFIPAQLLAGLVLKLLGPDAELWQIVALFGGINVLFILYETIFRAGTA